MAHYQAVRDYRAEMFVLRLRMQLGIVPPQRGNVFAGFDHEPLPERVPLSVRYTHHKDPIPFDSLSGRRWRKIETGRRWGGNWESAWFRFEGRVPAAWKGEEVLFRISTGSEACVFDPNGTPLQGLGAVRDDYPAVHPARGGERLKLLVEAAANQQQGIKQDCRLERASLERFRRDRWALYLDCEFLRDLAKGLPEGHSRRERIFYRLNEVADLYGSGSVEEVRACRRVTRALLAQPANASAHNVSALGHAHIDMAWLWPLRETIRKCGRSFATVLKYMERYPSYRFGASQPQQYEYVKDSYPGLFAKIKKAVKAGRWEAQGGMWVEPDGNVPSGESFVRQLLYGTRFFEKELGAKVNHLWMPDTFGYSAALPQLLKQAGIDYFMTSKLTWNKVNKFPHRSFWWAGLDGTRVFAHMPDGYNGTTTPRHLLKSVQAFCEKDRASRQLYLFGYGDGGGGPTQQHLEFIQRMKNTEELPRVSFEKAGDFFPKAVAESDDWPLWQGELYLETHRGTLTSQAWLKRANRKTEFALRDLEFLLVAGGGAGRYPKKELDQVWKLLLLNQFHDILPGSSIKWVYDDSRKHFREIEATLGKLRAEAEARLASRVAIPKAPLKGARPVLAVNTLSWKREAVVEIPLKKGERSVDVFVNGDRELEACPVQIGRRQGAGVARARVTIPSMGWRVMWVAPKTNRTRRSEAVLKATPRVLENEWLRLRFDARGELTSVYDKQHRREVLEPGQRGNALSVYEDLPNDYDAWDVDIHYESKAPEQSRCVKTTVVERGPVRVALRQQREVGASKIVQDIRLTAGSRVIEFVTSVNWKEKGHRMLRVAFPLAVRAEEATYDVQFGNLKRPTHRNSPWDAAKWEVCGHKWADLSEPGYGAALLNDCKYGYKVLGHTLDLNLLRSPTLPDPTADRGSQEFTYALLPHAGTGQQAGVVEAGYEQNIPALCIDAAGSRTSRRSKALPETSEVASVDESNVVIETVKKAEDSKAVIVRLYEAQGSHGTATVRFGFPVRRVERCTILERHPKRHSLRKDGSVRVKVRPFEVCTFRVQPR